MHARALGALAGACLLALPAAANADFPHVVSRGETLASVAAQDGLTVAAVAAANGLSPHASLIAGRILEIPPRGVLEKRSTSSTGTAPTRSDGETGSTGTGGGTYVVRAGDTLSAIAARAGTTVGELAVAEWDQAKKPCVCGDEAGVARWSEPIGSGTTELVSTTTGGEGTGGGTYVVRAGDTLSAIAARAGTTVGELASPNGIRRRNFVFAGMKLALPGGASRSGSGTTELVSTTTGGEGTGGGTYVVRAGDTLSAIAARAGTTVAELAALNGITRRNVLLAGTKLTLPGGSTGGGTEMVSTATGTSSASSVPTTTGSGGPPYPTNQVVSASEIASIANAEGVPPALAEAIGWQESGFNNSEVSDVGAVGVMQIVPDTWQWISDYVATVPLQPASASDNVRAGVLLLHALLAETGSYSETAAGYYQGLASIRRNGMYSSTRAVRGPVLALMSASAARKPPAG